MQQPISDVPMQHWTAFLVDCDRFFDRWAAIAYSFGWSLENILGCDPVKPFARLDRAGLCWLLDGREVLALTKDAASIRARSGAVLTYQRNCEASDQMTLPWVVAERSRPSLPSVPT